MKNLKHFSEFFKIYENNNDALFLNEHKLKQFLRNDEYFADGKIISAFINAAYHFSKEDYNQDDYNDVVDYAEDKLGKIPLFCVYFGTYYGQVYNGGHAQYFDNGYASSTYRGYAGNYSDIDRHKDFVWLFKKLGFDELPTGEIAYDIMDDFNYEPNENEEMTCYDCDGNGERDCPECNGSCRVDCQDCDGNGEYDDGEECGTCGGNGSVDCDECDGRGTVDCDKCGGDGTIEEETEYNKELWEKLDDRWGEIDEKIKSEIEDYLKTLYLDGEKIEDLYLLSNQKQKYNI